MKLIDILDRTTGKIQAGFRDSGKTFGEFLQNEGFKPEFGYVYRIKANLSGGSSLISVQPDDKIPELVTAVTVESCPKC